MRLSLLGLILATRSIIIIIAFQDTNVTTLVPSVECFMRYKWCQLLNLTLNATQTRFSISVSSNFSSTGHVMFGNSSFPVLTRVVCDTFRDTRHLHARNQSIEKLENDTFTACSFLQYVTLDHNRLMSLPDGLFVNNKRLEMIQLQSNQLLVLPPNVFHNLRSLQFLQLDRNRLDELPVELFRDLGRLKYLTIFGNPLVVLNAEKMIEYLPNVELISLRDLDLQCDRMNDVMDVFSQGSVIISKFTDYGYQARKRDYQPQIIKGVECLSDQQYQKVMEIRDRKGNIDGIMYKKR